MLYLNRHTRPTIQSFHRYLVHGATLSSSLPPTGDESVLTTSLLTVVVPDKGFEGPATTSVLTAALVLTVAAVKVLAGGLFCGLRKLWTC